MINERTAKSTIRGDGRVPGLYFSPIGNAREGRKIAAGELQQFPNTWRFKPGSRDPAPGFSFSWFMTAQPSSLASMVICALSSLDTGQPDLALFASSRNFALSAPGIFAETSR